MAAIIFFILLIVHGLVLHRQFLLFLLDLDLDLDYFYIPHVCSEYGWVAILRFVCSRMGVY